MKEAGIVAHLYEKWAPKQKRCRPLDVTTKISLEQVKTAFYAMGTGLFLALLFLLMEKRKLWQGKKLR